MQETLHCFWRAALEWPPAVFAASRALLRIIKKSSSSRNAPVSLRSLHCGCHEEAKFHEQKEQVLAVHLASAGARRRRRARALANRPRPRGRGRCTGGSAHSDPDGRAAELRERDRGGPARGGEHLGVRIPRGRARARGGERPRITVRKRLRGFSPPLLRATEFPRRRSSTVTPTRAHVPGNGLGIHRGLHGLRRDQQPRRRPRERHHGDAP